MHTLTMDNRDRGVALTQRVGFLKEPQNYPEPTTEVKAVETHRSWVFLTDEYAYKLKKPERYAFLDVSTLSARKYYCEEELRLNRRLAGDVYIATVPLTLDRLGKLELDGEGSIVDWLVKMRRLPADRMLDVAIGRKRIHDEHIQPVAQKLANFYRASAAVSIAASDFRSGLERWIRASLLELRRPVFGLNQDLVEAPCAAQLKLLERAPGLFDQRIKQGRIIEAHGDLRPEHICLLEPEPVIIDCLEFSRELRTLDAAADLGFLAQECDQLAAPEVGEIFFEVYSGITHDRPPTQLISFYKSYWACLRARLCAGHLVDPARNNPRKWSRRAMEYLVRAGHYAAAL